MGLSTNSTMIYLSSFSHGLFTAVPWTSAGRSKYGMKLATQKMSDIGGNIILTSTVHHFK